MPLRLTKRKPRVASWGTTAISSLSQAETKSRQDALYPLASAVPEGNDFFNSQPFLQQQVMRSYEFALNIPKRRIMNVEGWGSFTALPKLNLKYRVSLGAGEGRSDVHSQSLFTRCFLPLFCRSW